MLPANSSSSSRPSVWEWVQAALLIANLGWTTLCRGGVRPDTQIVTTLLTAALVIVHALSRAFGPGARNSAANAESTAIAGSSMVRVHPAGWWFLPFLVYAAINVCVVTPVRWLGWLDWFGWAQLVAVFWVTLNGFPSRWPRRVVFFSLVLLAIAGVLLACYQRFVRPDWVVFGQAQPVALHGRASGPFGIPNSFAGLLLLLVPPVLGLTFRRNASPTERVWWGWVAVVLLCGLILAISRGAWVSLVVALTAWPLLAARGSWSRRARIAVLILAGLGALGVAMYWNSPAARARFTNLVRQRGEITRPQMWRGAWELFRDAPLVGTGAGSYNVLFERHRREGFRDEPLWAHNEYLNTLSDYGAVGFLLFFGPAAALALRCVRGRDEPKARRRDWLDSRTVLSGAGIGLLAFGLQMGLDFHLKIPALALTAATIAGLAISRACPVEESDSTDDPSPMRSSHRATVATAAVVVIGVGGWLVFLLPQLRAENRRQEARRAIDRLGATLAPIEMYAARLPAIRAALSEATRMNPANAQAWADASYAAALAGLANPGATTELGRDAEALAQRALALSGVNNEFWIRRGVARDMQGRWADASQDFINAVALAPNDALTWFYYADHLSRLKWAKEPAEAALAFCLRLDPGNAAGLALRQRLAINQKAH